MAAQAQSALDPDPEETREWVEAIESVVAAAGSERASQLLELAARASGTKLRPSTPYLNTIAAADQPQRAGEVEIEQKIEALVRWNAAAMVVHANRENSGLGGHIATYQSAATLYEVGFNHFWRGSDHASGGDLVYIQGHSSPGIYARALLEGRLSEQQLLGFRRELSAGGLSSYPHPWLMPEFWQFPTVSMGLGPVMAIHQALFLRYLSDRGLGQHAGRRVWCFLGDGETDEPEALGQIALAGREQLDSLVFVVNCNLQRLDGPVLGNGKIIQHLEQVFAGAGWNVIKVIWGSGWDPLLAADQEGLLVQRMSEVVDGDYQTLKSRDGGFIRERFFGADPRLLKLVAHLSDEEIWGLRRGGHDPAKVYAAYAAATEHRGQPTVILAKTVKGESMGRSGQARNTTHQQKQMDAEALAAFSRRLGLELPEAVLERGGLFRPEPESVESEYLRRRREELGGPLPRRRARAQVPIPEPAPEPFAAQFEGSEGRSISTTMAMVRLLGALVRDTQLGPRIVPIVPDESRTFGMEGMFRGLGIHSHTGQGYEPEDAASMLVYRESREGQILQAGINEAGAISQWIAAATSYSHSDLPTLPFYIFYSMFGFQRVGDLAWAAGDSRARGFLLGATAGRTTLNGEGLQHQDGHSHLLASTVPNCVSYDPAYGYEVAVIVAEGIHRMLENQEDVFYYLTLGNENYPMPPLPSGAEPGILRGMHRVKATEPVAEVGVRLLGSGALLNEAIAASDVLGSEFGVAAEVWSVTSYTELRREALGVERQRRLRPEADHTRPWVEQCLGLDRRPTVAVSDYVKALPDGIRAWVGGPYEVLGTDGYGRSDERPHLRDFFEVDRKHIVVAAMRALQRAGEIEATAVAEAIARLGLDPTRPDPALA